MATLAVVLPISALVFAQTGSTQSKPGATMQATGTFDVKLAPQQSTSETTPDPTRGRMSIDKQFHGALEGRSAGEMLTGGNPASGSAGYVAVERVTGTLDGKRGSFLLQHSGTMNGGKLSLTITVIPGSGTGELEGISGSMTIVIAEGKHSYTFDYSLAK
jgi:hypothetical protein